MAGTPKHKIEFGDFQTPDALARKVCSFLASKGVRPAGIVEPTCGTGAFLAAASCEFRITEVLLGLDIDKRYLKVARERLSTLNPTTRVDLRHEDFFDFDWSSALLSIPDPLLIIGNPPWVTSSRQGSLGGSNLPSKSNFQQLNGIEAKTGKSNFDISEWMTIRLLESVKRRQATVALLLKTSVARRVLQYVWSQAFPIEDARLLMIDASREFGASTSAGVLIVGLGTEESDRRCDVYSHSNWQIVQDTFGQRGHTLVTDVAAYDRTAHLISPNPRAQKLRWRSGIKHDCAKILELTREHDQLVNRLGEPVDVEDPWVFPLMKGSAVARENSTARATPNRFVILTQKRVGDDTHHLVSGAPKLWKYLKDHQEHFDRRRSSVYKGQAPFSVFGVGPYTFNPWKVAICGLYKHLGFAVVGPRDDRPVLFDDTSYYLSFDSEEEANLIGGLLRSDIARKFYQARIFWDMKRPITAEVLQQLDLERLADALGRMEEWDRYVKRATLFEFAKR